MSPLVAQPITSENFLIVGPGEYHLDPATSTFSVPFTIPAGSFGSDTSGPYGLVLNVIGSSEAEIHRTSTSGVVGPSDLAGLGLRLSDTWPNPSARDVTLEAFLPGAGAYGVTVFDASGRIVRALEPIDAGKPGSVLINWDGRDRQGSFVSNGIYFVNITQGTETTSRKVVIDRR